ncbi:sulfite reductase flavoprotein subunit alpha [Pseudoalteromonas sp. MMG012]|uniref:diflavin oxidoreductase n=1 Tax=Pseudoalteromonas sp. MMG012 TaxID=2822686 RepID=UPI001B3A1177|nr:sulfite reductase flavoprotein subunit alpha [Pseudoalteromonas sp. MMG012]MBQ4851387.1 sulfite reductase flavoprotein subunit alpha [Pseudoalteromonas sp. MMG012]
MTHSNNTQLVPYLPENMPFNDEQKQWLGGFLAGLHSRLLIKEETVAQSVQPAMQIKPLTIIYGSQTGNAENLAEEAAQMAKNHGLLASVFDMDDISVAQLSETERLLIITSTYGDGEMPDNAQLLWDEINAESAPSFASTYFSVLALVDTNYDDFCIAGIQWDERLEQLGATRVAQRIDCDVAYEAPAEQWMAEALPTIAQKGSNSEQQPAHTSEQKPKKHKAKFNKESPLKAQLLSKTRLTGECSSKETIHYELSLMGSGEQYDAGDALNIVAHNSATLVNDLLSALNARAEQHETYDGKTDQLEYIFTELLEIRQPSKDLIHEIARQSSCPELLSRLDDNQAMSDYLWGVDTVQLLKRYPDSALSPAQFIQLAKPMAPRAYSISSSLKKHPDQVHLTIASVRYEKGERQHNGVCSTYLADLVKIGEPVTCYFSANKHFSVPNDLAAPIIMIGPGTGIAPFRAFLEEREATHATGDNWLFFGDRNEKTDYLYEQELTQMQQDGLLTRLDLAFSRDQAEKTYVQDKMLAQGEALFNWLEQGAYLYVCGDAYKMAKDVDTTLQSIIQQYGQYDESQTQDYMANLKKQKRYVRDVY